MGKEVIIDVLKLTEELFQKQKDDKFSDPESKKGIFCYRGLANSDWGMEPSIIRQKKTNAESQGVCDLINEIPDEFQNDKTAFQKLLRCQHHGLPTRLMDVTLNPLVAIYFACDEKLSSGKDGKVLMFYIPKERILDPDGDRLSIICNLALLKDDDKKKIEKILFSNGKIVEKNKRKYLKKRDYYKRLLYSIQQERFFFEDKIKWKEFEKEMFIKSYKANKRIIAQSGAFITAAFWNDTIKNDTKIEEIIVKTGDKERLKKQLKKFDISKETMFPDIDHIAEAIKVDYENS